MSVPYAGEIIMMANTYPPQGWLICDGSYVYTSEHQALFTMIGTQFGSTHDLKAFRLPSLGARIPVGAGTGPGLSTINQANYGGSNSYSLGWHEIPEHTHTANTRLASASLINDTQENAYISRTVNSSTMSKIFDKSPTEEPDLIMNFSTLAKTGLSEPHENRQPFICLNYYICSYGSFAPHN